MFYEELYHYGTKRHSGRYEWGSGENPYQHESWFLGEMTRLRDQGMTDTEIAKAMGMSSTEFRTRRTVEKNAKIAADATHALELKDKGFSNVEIGNALGISEGTVRNYLKPAFKMRESKTELLANELKKQVEKHPYLDVGAGVELQLGVSKTQMKPALALLKEQGYKVNYIKVEQATNPGKYTSVQVLTKDDVPYGEIYKNRDKIISPEGVWFENRGTTKRGLKPPVNVDSKRIAIRYSEDGGTEKDGVVELRRGVSDISLGKNNYAQVRIAVDGTHYIKGMAMYSDDLPKGVDILFNTNKSKDVPMIGPKNNTVLKPMEDDKDNPFGSTINRQPTYLGKDGKEHQSALNIVNEPEDWDKWSKALSSQFLSKQNPSLAKRQLDLVYKQKRQEYEDICSVNNPVVKQRLLLSFADDCDSAAVDLKAAPLPRQQTHVILPLTTIKDNEIYAPNYRNGEEVILVRHPHEGTFQIPRLIVNNNNKQGKSLLGQAPNAVGISAKAAEQLSGADFDGDTVIVIPTKNQALKATKPLKALEGFDPKEYYKAYPGMPETGPKTGFHKQTEMGKISNLITDMTIKGATPAEIARATKHSMCVIDAEKHNLDWRRSYQENDIAQLKEKYQGGKNKGASTLISKASSEYRVPEGQRRDGYKINPETGEKIFSYTGNTWTDKKGKEHLYPEKSTKMYETSDAFSLSSGTNMENIYATHANKLKALGNEARKEYISTPNLVYNPSAAKTYSAEIDSLNAKLNNALKNHPNERKAQLAADVIFKAKKEENPKLKDDKEEARRVKAQIIEETRARAGTTHRKDRNISITDREWEAIQAGALHHSRVQKILQNTDLDDIRERATPRDVKNGMTPSKIATAKAMLRMGHSQADVAKALGVSVTTLKNNDVI